MPRPCRGEFDEENRRGKINLHREQRSSLMFLWIHGLIAPFPFHGRIMVITSTMSLSGSHCVSKAFPTLPNNLRIKFPLTTGRSVGGSFGIPSTLAAYLRKSTLVAAK